jgi:hypothetical protein
MDYEDEAFNYIEQQAKQRKEAVLQALHNENERLGLYEGVYYDALKPEPTKEQMLTETKERLMAEINVLTELVQGLSIKIAEMEKTHVKRNDVLDEVTKEIEQLAIAFGVDTVHSFMMLIRSMKE